VRGRQVFGAIEGDERLAAILAHLVEQKLHASDRQVCSKDESFEICRHRGLSN